MNAHEVVEQALMRATHLPFGTTAVLEALSTAGFQVIGPELLWKQSPAIPQKEGWYRVMHPGDYESLEGHMLYDFPDYEAWAYWTPATPEEFEDFNGGYKGHWLCMHDEAGESIFAFAGPIPVPKPFKT